MNERIRELAKCNERIENFFQTGPVQRAAIEEFAELIVRECINIAYEYDKPKLSGPGLAIASNIESHFDIYIEEDGRFERLKELAEQAFQPINDISTEGVADRYTFEQAWFQVYNQKFAELIVRECSDICNKIYFDRYPDAEDFERSEEGDAIKKHFGVEE